MNADNPPTDGAEMDVPQPTPQPAPPPSGATMFQKAKPKTKGQPARSNEAPLHSKLVVEPSPSPPPARHNNPHAISSCLCLICRGPLDFPYVFQQCQHVVCASCAKNHATSLCQSCEAINAVNQSNKYITGTQVVGFSRQVAVLVQHVAGHQWAENARARLERENSAVFMGATTPSVRWERVQSPAVRQDDDYQSDGRGKKKKRYRDDDDEYDKDNEGCCMCLARNTCCCPCECCCPRWRTLCCKKSEKCLAGLGRLILGFLVLVALATLINWLITGNSNLTNILGNESDYQAYLGTNAPDINTPYYPPTPPPPQKKLEDIDPAMLELLLNAYKAHQQGTSTPLPASKRKPKA